MAALVKVAATPTRRRIKISNAFAKVDETHTPYCLFEKQADSPGKT